MNEHIQQKLKMLPDTPGVYKFRDYAGEIIYVGKAISLKNRVRQYFHSALNHPPKVAAMVEKIEDLEYILTDSEAEALTLESNLIKQYRPRYNILLKDDKHFPYVRIDMQKPFPRVEVVRKVRSDGAKYFGPYLSGIALNDAISTVRDYFPIRHCKKDILHAIERHERPCLMYHIGKCIGPCTGRVTREEYMRLIADVGAFLSGKTEEVVKKLEDDMAEAADKLDFEHAAQLRDRIRAIRLIGEKQKAIAANTEERDIFAFIRQGTDAIVFGLFMRSGKIIGAERYELIAPDDAAAEVMESFIKQFYSSTGYVPKEVVVRDTPSDLAALEAWLSSKRSGKVSLVVPQRGDKKKLVDMAYKNGIEHLEKANLEHRREWERHEGALAALAVLLGLDAAPDRIEAYDNSNLQGRDAVSAMIVFTDGRPSPKDYRRFRIKTVEGADDYATMREVIHRRFTRLVNEREQGKTDGFAAIPGLVLIDGGKSQLAAAQGAMEQLGVGCPMIGLAKRLEEIFLPGCDEPIVLESSSPVLHLLQRVRDEAHRFAITYHRSLRAKTALFSVLDGIPGVGPKRRRLLFDTFVSLDKIKEATLDELKAVKGMSASAAKSVWEYFHQ